jgi:nucleotide-binding universal stress UspA family protein
METKTLVVPLDGSEYAERAIPVAAAMASRIGGGVQFFTAEFGGTPNPREYLEEVAGRDVGCPADTRFALGKYPASALVELLADHDDYTLCMTTHGRGRAAWAAVGSVAESVLRDASQPVVLVGPHCRPDFFVKPGGMLIASSGEMWAPQAAGDVASWAARLDLDANVVQVVHPLDTETTEHPAHVAAVAAQFGVEPRHVTLIRDEHPAGAVLRAADQLGARVLAMGTHARHGLARVALGSVTVAVVRRALCPVLAVPHAFGA